MARSTFDPNYQIEPRQLFLDPIWYLLSDDANPVSLLGETAEIARLGLKQQEQETQAEKIERIDARLISNPNL